MDNNKKDKNVFGEEPKETKETKRTRSPNRTKQDKLDKEQKSIEYHDKCIKNLEAKKAEIDRVIAKHKKEKADCLAKLEKIQNSVDRVTKAQRKAAIKAKLAKNEELTPEEHNFLLSTL